MNNTANENNEFKKGYLIEACAAGFSLCDIISIKPYGCYFL